MRSKGPGQGSIRYSALFLRLRKFSAAAALAAASTGIAAAQPDDLAVQVDQFIPVTALGIEQQKALADEGNSGPSGGLSVIVAAADRRIVLDLVRNDRLVAKVRSRLELNDDSLTVYKGQVRHVPGSWARVSVDNGRVAGVVWDGNELLIIDRMERFGLAAAADEAADTTIVVRAADIGLTFDDATLLPGKLHHHSAHGPSLHELSAQSPESRQHNTATLPSFGAISLGLVIADGVAERLGDGEVQAAIEWANIADGIFSAQANIHLDLEYIENLTGDSGAFASTDSSEILAELGDRVVSTPELASLGIVHLLTNTPFEDRPARGVAFLGGACSPGIGVGATLMRDPAVAPLILAHEIGHSLNAPHDGETGSACESSPTGFLMSFTGVLDNATLSNCSIGRISEFLRDASCLVEVPTGEIELEAPLLPNVVYYRAANRIDLNVNNIGLESAVNSEVAIDGPGLAGLTVSEVSDREADCTTALSAPSQTCNLTSLYAGETVTVSAEFVPQATGVQTLQASVSAANDTNPANNMRQFSLNVQPASQVIARVGAIDNDRTYEGGSIAYNVVVQNIGDFDTEATLHLTADPRFSLTSTAACSSAAAGQLQCDLGQIAAQGSADVDVNLHVPSDLGFSSAAQSLFQTIDVAVTTSLFNVENNSGDELVFVVFAVAYDIETGFTQAPAAITVNDTQQFELFLTNRGPDTPNELRYNIAPTAGIDLELVEISEGDCSKEGSSIRCQFDGFGVGRTATATVSYTGTESGPQRITLNGAPDAGTVLSESGILAIADFEVLAAPATPPPPPPATPPPPPAADSGGGGGHSSALFLLVLAALRLLRRFRPAWLVMASCQLRNAGAIR